MSIKVKSLIFHCCIHLIINTSLITDIYQSEILDSSDSGFLISDGDKNSNDLIESGVLSSEFGLALVVGSQKNGVTQILTSDDEVDIGQKVRVMLQHTVTDYWSVYQSTIMYIMFLAGFRCSIARSSLIVVRLHFTMEPVQIQICNRSR